MIKNHPFKIQALLCATLVCTACPVFERPQPVSGVEILLNGTGTGLINLEKGETITLMAAVSPAQEDVFIIWEIGGENAAIISSGEGPQCTIRGIKTGKTGITARAWRTLNDQPAEQTAFIEVTEAKVRDIVLTGPSFIGRGEELFFGVEIVPAWVGAAGLEGGASLIWNTSGGISLTETRGGLIIEGLTAGPAAITAAAGNFTKNFDILVREPGALTGLAVFNGPADITSQSVEVGLYEEIALSAVITPDVYTFLKWESSNPDQVSVDRHTGLIKGLTAAGSSVITVSASGLEKNVTVTVTNPVTGIRVLYANSKKLPVSNVIWLSPGEKVTIQAETTGGVPDEISWTGANEEAGLSANGGSCTITGVTRSLFDAPPAEIRITARNNDNRRPVSALVRVKVQPAPIWAWDRARDTDLNEDYPATLSTGNNTPPPLNGRGKFEGGVPLLVSGNPIEYTPSGLKLNSSNNSSGKNPEPAGAPGNSTRVMIGTNLNRTTNPADPANAGENENNWDRGAFDFLSLFCDKNPDGSYEPKANMEGKMIRVSVDYEIIWTAGAGRDMWIMLNNNQANAAQSLLSTNSQILVEPLTAAQGTRATAVTSLDVIDFAQRKIPGYKTLANAFIGIVCLSNGGSAYVSGVRIEIDE